MEEEYEFRAWDEKQNYMAYQGTPDLETIQSFMFHFGDKLLMQYLGIRDRNGKKVYKGDIIKNVDDVFCVDGFIGEHTDEFDSYIGIRSPWLINKGVVIGNIIENSDIELNCN